MKFLLFVLLTAIFFNTASADDKYEKAMKSNLEKIDEARTADDFIKIANNFERIARAENDKWLPYYYTSMLYILASFSDTVNTQKDIYLDKADEFIYKADSLSPDNSEVYALKGLIGQARMQIDPMNRWQKYGTESGNNFKRAMEIDSLNPRPEYLIGVGTYHTPEQFGGGPAAAKPILENSLRKYEQFEPVNDLMPDWGKKEVLYFLEQINK